MELAQKLQSLLVVALVGHPRGHLDLLLYLLVVVHDEDCQNALGLDRLAIGTVTRTIDDDLGLDGGHHWLL